MSQPGKMTMQPRVDKLGCPACCSPYAMLAACSAGNSRQKKDHNTCSVTGHEAMVACSAGKGRQKIDHKTCSVTRHGAKAPLQATRLHQALGAGTHTHRSYASIEHCS